VGRVIVGSAEVRINADGTLFGPQLQGILKSQHAVVRQSGQQAGNEYGNGFGQGLSGSVRKAMQGAQREISSGLNVGDLIDAPLAASAKGTKTETAVRTKMRSKQGRRAHGQRVRPVLR
jgi:hypothetical protein